MSVANSKRQLLDPIGTLSHIVALAFKPVNTKIGITNHAVTIQDSYYFQWLDRFWNSDSRENISLLYNIIVRVIEWYVLPLSGKYKIDSNTSFDYLNKEDKELFWKCLEKMIIYSCIAFDKLQYTYNDGASPTNVVLTTQFFINTLKDSLDGRYTKSMLPTCLTKSEENKTFFNYKSKCYN